MEARFLKIDLHDLGYLQSGTYRQRAAFEVIEQLGLFHELHCYRPALAGTIPLGVDLESSDLDVICQTGDLKQFVDHVRQVYGHLEGFRESRSVLRGIESVVVGFRFESWSFELFAQDVPVAEQFACLHLLAEAALLVEADPSAVEAIRKLKRQGWKTEPAFAQHFGILGDPYEVLAEMGRQLLSTKMTDPISARDDGADGSSW